MKRYIAQRVVIARLAVLALFTLCFAQLPVRAQYSGTHALYQDIFIPSTGLAPGQNLRFTVFNPDGKPLRAQVKLHDERGAVVAQSNEAAMPAGAFHSFDFNRSDIRLAGEAGTGRVQLSPSIRLTFSEAINTIAVSMEIVDIQDGTSNTIFFAESPPSPVGGSGNDFLNSGFGNDVMMGIVPGQTLRINVFHPSDKQKGATSIKTVPVKVTLSDLGGNVIAQTTANAIPEGEFRSFDFNRYALPLPGEPGTGRLQVRARLEVSGDPNATTLLVPSFELIDSTGRTAAAGKRFIIFVPGPRPLQQ